MEQNRGNAITSLSASFEGRSVTAIERDGEPLFLPREIATALDLGDVERFAERVVSDLVEGRHYVKVVGVELAGLKASGLADQRSARLLLFTETGLYRVLMRSRAPRAEDFQEWIASEVLPQLRRTGRYEAPAAAPAVTKASVLVELHGSGTINDHALVNHLDDDDLATLPASVTVGMLRRLSGGATPLPPLADDAVPVRRQKQADPNKPTPIDALRAVMLWARDHEDQIATWGGFGGLGAVIVPPNGGRWLGRKECASGWRWISLDRREVAKVVNKLGLSEVEVIRAWADQDFLIRDKGGYLACTTSIPGTAERVRMLRFTRQAVERTGSIILEATHAAK